jgi:hypothetical protein
MTEDEDPNEGGGNEGGDGGEEYFVITFYELDQTTAIDYYYAEYGEDISWYLEYVYPEENRIERTENVKNIDHYIQRIDEMIDRKKRYMEMV